MDADQDVDLRDKLSRNWHAVDVRLITPLPRLGKLPLPLAG